MDNKDGITLSWHGYYELQGEIDELRIENTRLKKALNDVNLNAAQQVIVEMAADRGKLIVTNGTLIYGPKTNTEMLGIQISFPESVGIQSEDWRMLMEEIFYSAVQNMTR